MLSSEDFGFSEANADSRLAKHTNDEEGSQDYSVPVQSTTMSRR